MQQLAAVHSPEPLFMWHLNLDTKSRSDWPVAARGMTQSLAATGTHWHPAKKKQPGKEILFKLEGRYRTMGIWYNAVWVQWLWG